MLHQLHGRAAHTIVYGLGCARRSLRFLPTVLMLFLSQVTCAQGLQGPVADLEATILQIGGPAMTGTGSIPAGRSLTQVLLTTSDPETSDGDGFKLGVAQAGFRVRGGAMVPGTPAEQVTFRINGNIVATSVPDLRARLLHTDAGPINVFVFTASGVTYAIPRNEFQLATRTVAPVANATAPVGPSDFTFQYGLLPVGARPRVGFGYSESSVGQYHLGSSTGLFTVLDADNIRRNSDSNTEELVCVGAPAAFYTSLIGTRGEEVRAIVSLSDGNLLEVLGVRFTRVGSYAQVQKTWLFDQATLAEVGATVDDIAEVVWDAPTDHGLTWQDLGFELE